MNLCRLPRSTPVLNGVLKPETRQATVHFGRPDAADTYIRALARALWCPVRILSGGNHGSRMTTPSPARCFRKQRSVCATRSSVFTYPMELKRQRMTS